MDIVKIGKYIAENRKKKNMTQEQLAEIIGAAKAKIVYEYFHNERKAVSQ